MKTIAIHVFIAEKTLKIVQQYIKNLTKNNNRSSSKAERALGALLKNQQFKRHTVIYAASGLRFDVDIISHDKQIWIEYDGPFHILKVYSEHKLEKTKLRDMTEENEAIKRNVLLIRVDNIKYSLEEQITFINQQISKWDKITGKLVKLY